MAIQDLLYNNVSSIKHGVEGGLSSLSTRLSNLLGGATAQLSSLWDGGFVGISADPSELTEAINTYITNLNGILENFDTAANIEVALKGEVATAATQYVAAIKNLISAYCQTYKSFNSILEQTAQAGFDEGDKGDAASIDQVTEQINSDAQAILNDIK